MKKLISIALLLIIIVFGIVEYRKYYLKEASKESINLVNEMTLIKNEECDKFYISNEITNKVYNHVTKLISMEKMMKQLLTLAGMMQ